MKIKLAHKGGSYIDINEHLRDMVQLHFDDKLGSPYWLKKKKNFSFNPLKEVNTLDDLHLFDFANVNDLRQAPIGDFIPKNVLKEGKDQFIVAETDGTTGPPCRIPWHKRTYTEMFSWLNYFLNHIGFPSGGDWLHIGPSGPHLPRFLTYEFIRQRNGFMYTIDLDPRWLRKAGNDGNKELLDKYILHLKDQIINVVNNVDFKFLTTTPKILASLPNIIDLKDLDLKGIIFTATTMDEDTYKKIKKYYHKSSIIGTYGNSFCGDSVQLPKKNSLDVDYYPDFPHTILEVRDFHNPTKQVNYNERGKLLFHRLTEDLFWPNMLERDEAERIPPADIFSWDGVRNLSPSKKEFVKGAEFLEFGSVF